MTSKPEELLLPSPNRPQDRRGFRVAIICALSLEAEMVELLLDKDWSNDGKRYGKAPKDSNVYTAGVLAGHNVVLAYMPGTGGQDAAAVATGLRLSFPKVEFAFVVGICGVVPVHPETGEDVVLGDCIVSTSVVHYDYGRRGPAGFQRKRDLEAMGRASDEVRAVTAKWMTLKTKLDLTDKLAQNLQKITQNHPDVKYPGMLQDRLFPPSYIHNHSPRSHTCRSCNTSLGICNKDCNSLGCDTKQLIRRERPNGTLPRIHFGVYGSSNTVLKSGKDRDTLSQADKLLAFEMEGSGVWKGFPNTIVVKSACDYADSHKNKLWQRYAAATAAAGLAAMLTKLELPDEEEERPREPISMDNEGKTRTEKALVEIDRKCLQTLYVQPPYRETKDRTPERVEGTCGWLLSQKTFQEWASADTGVLLISADPGCGKSVLAKHLIDHALPEFNKDSLICYYFFKEQVQDKLAPALCAILHQLLSVDQVGLRSCAAPEYEKLGNNLANDSGSLGDIICKVIQRPSAQQVIIVLDALDEIEAYDCKNLFRLLRRLEHSNNVKILLTSRPYDQIISNYDPAAISSRLHIPGENESEAISMEVTLVVKERLKQLHLQGRIDEQQRHDLEDKLIRQTQRTYLFVHLLFDLLESNLKKTQKEMDDLFVALPQSVDDAYTRILNRSIDNNETRQMVRQILSTLLAAEKPLSVREMQCASKIGGLSTITSHDELALEDDADFQHKLRNWCGLFIQIFDGKVTFIHQTAREFLLRGPRGTTIPLDIGHQWGGAFSLEQSHAMLADVCVRYLSLFDDFSSYSAVRTLDVEELRMQAPFLIYCAKHWDSHFEKGHIKPSDAICEQAFRLCDSGQAVHLVELWLTFALETDFKGFNPLSGGSSVIVPALRTAALMPRLVASLGQAESWNLFNQGLSAASYCGNIQNIRALLDYPRSSQVGNHWGFGRGPLHYAILAKRSDVVELLLESGCPVNGRNIEGEPYLSYAISQCISGSEEDKAVLATILLYKPDLTLEDSRGYNPLSHAVNFGATQALSLLLEREIAIDNRDSEGRTALHVASLSRREDSTTMLKELLNHGADVNAQDKQGRTPLHCAALVGMWENIILLLQYRADVHIKSHSGWSPLHYLGFSIHTSKKAGVAISALLEHGITIDDRDNSLFTPLHHAAQQGNRDTVVMFIARAADIDARNAQGSTPLSLAAAAHYFDTLKLLLLLGADIMTEDNFGHTPRYYALIAENNQRVITNRKYYDYDDSNDEESISLEDGRLLFLPQHHKANAKWVMQSSEIKSILATDSGVADQDDGPVWECIKEAEMVLARLIQYDDFQEATYFTTKVNDKDVCQCLHYVTQHRSAKRVQMLLWLGFDPNFKMEGGIPLHYAGEEEKARMLIQYGSEVNATDNFGWTLLHRAAFGVSNEAVGIIRLLIRSGANVNALSEVGATPLHLAALYGFTSRVECLLQAGADPRLEENNHMTAVSIAAASESSTVENLKLILENGGNVETTKIETAPLYLAMLWGRDDNVKAILQHGVPILLQAECIRLLMFRNFTRSHKDDIAMLNIVLAHNKNNKLVEQLKSMADSGASAKDLDQIGTSMLNDAFATGDMERAIALLKTGANFRVRDRFGWTTLHIAVSSRWENAKATQRLTWYGPDVNALLTDSTTALHYAIQSNSFMNAESLLGIGANPNESDVHGWTPLHVAASLRSYWLVILLRKYGGDLAIRNENGLTPIDLHWRTVSADLRRDRGRILTRRWSCYDLGNDRKHTMDPFNTFCPPLRRASIHFDQRQTPGSWQSVDSNQESKLIEKPSNEADVGNDSEEKNMMDPFLAALQNYNKHMAVIINRTLVGE